MPPPPECSEISPPTGDRHRAGRREAPRWLPEGWAGTVVRIAGTEVMGGLAITAAVVAALVWANLAPHASYERVWGTVLRIPLLPASEFTTLRQWVDNGLMAVFFFAVGLEVGRERTYGALRELHNALLPVVAALGGMAGAAAVYVVTATAIGGSTEVLKGWGVPMATDVAFTLGAMALLGRRVPPALRVFVLALAVADDVGSVVVLAFVSSAHVRVWYLVAALAWLVAIVLLRRRVRSAAWPYLVAAGGAWVLFAWAGIEPTLAGAFVGMITPSRRLPDSRASAGQRLEGITAEVSALVVLPLFALANTGIVLSVQALTGQSGRVVLSVVVARLVGKAVGITAATALLARSSVLRLPEGVTWPQLAGAAAMCGMGFTVPLLFATTAFAGSPRLLSGAQIGLLLGTVAAFVVGGAALAAAARGRGTGDGPGP